MLTRPAGRSLGGWLIVSNREGVGAVLIAAGWVLVGFGISQWLALGVIGWGLMGLGVFVWVVGRLLSS
jgi:hypothetical protein